MPRFISPVLLSILLLLPLSSEAARRSPVDGGTVTSGVGWRVDPFGSGRMVYHNGYDIAVPTGTPVYPTQVGTVYFAGQYKGYGNLVAIQHGEGYVTFYGHNAEVLVKVGQQVDCNTVIALAGSTGRSTGPHVHYEIRQIPGYKEHQREKLQKELKTAVAEKIEGWVEGYESGKGGPERETIMPQDPYE
ncbi:M23 family metallopeptidase [Geobacter sp. DSM 9736]|uniref:M23 family metallopeptidase n=1 Tax=Geobacter sp. DSM 9736 TaxID=1277350 RepID=UPI000B50E20C|nr:M23 family metallopeptidase [Geobacter sp. DSM 9736]SNB47860.1 Peptidase family M23 [Geobacter sp. DSM 9736]